MLIIYLIIAALVVFSGLDSRIGAKNSKSRRTSTRNKPRRSSPRRRVRRSSTTLQAQLGLATSHSSRATTARWWWE